MCFLPSLGSTFLIFIDFHNFEKDMQIIIARIFSVSGCLLKPLGLILGRLGVNLGQNWVNVGPTWTNMSPTWANLSQLIAALGPTWCQPGPSWVQLVYGKRGKSLFFIGFSSFFVLSAFMQY